MAVATVALSLVPGRAEASHKSELTTQWHYGEPLLILENLGEWALVESQVDGYPAWIRTNQMLLCSDEFPDNDWQGKSVVQQAFVSFPKPAEGHPRWLSFGAWLSEDKKEYLPKPWSELAREWLGAPYLWGGKSPMGVDCSGLTQLLWRTRGVHLKRDASQQAQQGSVVQWWLDAKEGDLAFFGDEEGHINHVGLLLSPTEILHASGEVRIDKFDQQGIYHSQLKKYTHQLRFIQRPG